MADGIMIPATPPTHHHRRHPPIHNSAKSSSQKCPRWQLWRTCRSSTGLSRNHIVPFFLGLCARHRCAYSARWRVFDRKPNNVSCNEAMIGCYVGTRIHIKTCLYVSCNNVYCWITISEWYESCYRWIPVCFVSILYLSSEPHSQLHRHC